MQAVEIIPYRYGTQKRFARFQWFGRALVIFSLASRRGCKSAITCSLTQRRSSYHGNLEGASPNDVFGIREIAKT